MKLKKTELKYLMEFEKEEQKKNMDDIFSNLLLNLSALIFIFSVGASCLYIIGMVVVNIFKFLFY